MNLLLQDLDKALAALAEVRNNQSNVVLPSFAHEASTFSLSRHRANYNARVRGLTILLGHPGSGEPRVTEMVYWLLEEVAKANVRMAAQSGADALLHRDIKQLKKDVADCTQQLREERRPIQPPDRAVAEALQGQIDRLQALIESIRDIRR